MKIRRLLVADGGVAARRILRTAHRIGLETVAVHGDADRAALHVREATAAWPLGAGAEGAGDPPMEQVIEAARASGADAVHPGCGALGDSPEFAQAVADAGLTWAGPAPDAIRTLASPARLEELAHARGIPWLPPERVLPRARHVQVQLIADMHGRCLYLGERDASVQRQHLKLVVEAPSPAVDASLRERIGQHAVELARSAGFVGAGTMEFLLDEHGRFWVTGMNPRLQVEHGVTELVSGLDLVEWQLRIACGERLPYRQEHLHLQGHAIGVHLCAQDEPSLPHTKRVQVFHPPPAADAPGGGSRLRFDHALFEDLEITPPHGALLGTLMAHAPTREGALARLLSALDALRVLGLATNRRLLAACLRHPTFASGQAHTDFLALHGDAMRRALAAEEFGAAPDAAFALLLPHGPAAALASPFCRPWRVRHHGDLLDLPVCEADGIAPPPVHVAPVGPGRWHLQSGAIDLFLEDASYDPPAGAAARQWRP